MDTIHDLKPLETVDLGMFLFSAFIVGSILFLIIVFVLIKLFKNRKRSTNLTPKVQPKPSSIKEKYLTELQEVNKLIESDSYSQEIVFAKLSEIIRGFVYEFYSKETLPKTKSELSEYQIKELDQVIENAYRAIFEMNTPDLQTSKELSNLVAAYIKDAV